jgi:hypothetical protein
MQNRYALDTYGHRSTGGQDEAARLMDEIITSIPFRISKAHYQKEAL